jgi:hypothetical protein
MPAGKLKQPQSRPARTSSPARGEAGAQEAFGVAADTDATQSS